MPASKETFLLAEPEPKSTEKTNKNEPAQKLLDWLQRWNKPTLCLRDIRVWGPKSLRTREKAVNAARILEQNGWLIPVWQRQYNAHMWRIVRKLIVQPKVADLNS